MALLVQKFGGTSVADCACIGLVARRILKAREQGHDVVVVVSAMAGETDRLIGLARKITDIPDSREMDVLLATGEQASMALLVMALQRQGVRARSYTGGQVAIVTDDVHTKARIREVGVERLRADVAAGVIPVVAGFQGVRGNGDTTTLGRGGSDTTAVAIAAALGADECQIYTDVEGVFTTDPRVVPEARRLDRITFEEMLELSSLGSKVLQIRAVEFAGKYDVPLRVLSTFAEGKGTLISYEEGSVEAAVVSGIAFTRDEAELTLLGVPARPGIASDILGPIVAANIDVDMIVQNVARDGRIDFTFTVHRNDFQQARHSLETRLAELGGEGIQANNRAAKISLVGVGMRSHSSIATRMFAALAGEGINIRMIATSEIKISVIVDEKYLELGVRALHEAFALDRDGRADGVAAPAPLGATRKI